MIKDLDAETECNIRKFADHTKLGGLADTSDGCAAIQRDFDRLEKRADRKQIKFNQVLPLGRNNPIQKYRLGADWLENSFPKKIWECWWATSSPCTLTAKNADNIMGCTRKSTVSR